MHLFFPVVDNVRSLLGRVKPSDTSSLTTPTSLPVQELELLLQFSKHLARLIQMTFGILIF